MLYQDGTVGKVVIDMKKNEYDIVEVEKCRNIVRIQEIIYEHQGYGNDYELVAVDNTGKIISLDAYSV